MLLLNRIQADQKRINGILELNNISKSFGAIKALDNVTLSLDQEKF